MHRIAIARGDAAEELMLDGFATVGGSLADAVLVAGAPPGALRLVSCASGVVVEAAASGLRAAGAALPPGARRLLRPGEHVELPGASLSVLAPAAPESTRAAAAALLRGAADGVGVPGPRLVVLTGREAGRAVPLGAGAVIGRGRSAELRIPDRQASRRHARVRPAPQGVTAEDLGSKNGLLVNGVRIDGPRALRPGDVLRVGETLVALEEPGAAAAPGRPLPSPPKPPRPSRPGRIAVRRAAAALLAVCAAALAVAGS